MTVTNQVKIGEIILFSEGCYSDYGYCGKVVFIKDCDLLKSKSDFLISHDKQEWGFQSLFVTWLVANQICMPLECREIHLGEYEFKIEGQ